MPRSTTNHSDLIAEGAKRLVQGRHQSPPIMPSQQHKTTVLGHGWEFALRYRTTCPYGAGGQTSRHGISGPCGNTLRRHRDTMEVPDHYIMQHSSTPSGIYAGIPTPQSNALGHRLPSSCTDEKTNEHALMNRSTLGTVRLHGPKVPRRRYSAMTSGPHKSRYTIRHLQLARDACLGV